MCVGGGWEGVSKNVILNFVAAVKTQSHDSLSTNIRDRRFVKTFSTH